MCIQEEPEKSQFTLTTKKQQEIFVLVEAAEENLKKSKCK